MTEELKETLKLIQQVAERALEEYKNTILSTVKGANYEDMRVVDVWVKWSIREEDMEYGVIIEDASPFTYDFQGYIEEYLKDNLPNNLGWNVCVELDW